MNDEIKKNKPGPKPKAKLGESEQAASPKPRQRVAMQGTASPTPNWAKDPNFKFRWCADYGKGKIERYKGALWEFVLDEDGNRRKRPGGEPLYAMKLPIHLWEEDQLAKRGKIMDINKQLKQDSGPDESGSLPEYLVEGQNIL